MLRNAVLELTVQRLNEEITERCMNKAKRRKLEDSYEWQESPDGLGWNMTASYQDDDDLLGIDDFFQKLSTSCRTRNSISEQLGHVEVTGDDNKRQICRFHIKEQEYLNHFFMTSDFAQFLKLGSLVVQTGKILHNLVRKGNFADVFRMFTENYFYCKYFYLLQNL